MWKDIKNYEGLYQVSDKGEVRSLNYNHTKKIKKLKLKIRKNGYVNVYLNKNGKQKTYLVHRLVAQTFIDNPFNKEIINHKDENPTNNCVENLEWCTTSYNINYGNRNKKVSEKLSALKKGVVNSSRSKVVRQYDLDWNFIQEFPSAAEVERQLGFEQNCISRCCRGYRNKAYNYHWKYLNQPQFNNEVFAV